ncbi:DNA-3-methyladenine glycosylase [Achromobacter mucicolens]|uniref:DNA-3-methyladenine glycosylase n=1 Tax=Achromobacter mucicolens TaxID=1389922 RepID=UPI0022F39BAC|nr:DNA-3-methyladenine glycosylase [Achromobacter mucicolens]WBX89131.1 DNA-3-methyladenine glycosylase [Achromobacter mucicolens]
MNDIEREDLLAQILSRPAPPSGFDDWADVLGEFADCLAVSSGKLSQGEIDSFIRVGAAFYRTLARAEAYRRESVWGKE